MILWFLGIATALTHPLTGVPAIIFLLLLTLDLTRDSLSFPKWLQKSFYIETITIGSISIPLMFLLNTLISSNFSTFLRWPATGNLPELLSWWPLTLAPTEAFFRPLFFEFGYFILAMLIGSLPLLLSQSFIGFMLIKTTIIRPYLLTALIFVLNALILAVFLEFPELIRYESFDYSRRLIDLALMTLIPLAAVGFIWVIQKAEDQICVTCFCYSDWSFLVNNRKLICFLP